MGGPAQHVIALTRGLDPSRYESELFVGAVGPGEVELTELDGPNRGLPHALGHRVPGLGPRTGLLADLRALRWLYERFRRDRPHIVHTHTAKAGAVGRLAAAFARVPVRVHTYHGHVLGGGYFSRGRTACYRFMERQLARLTHRLVAVGAAQAEELARRHRIAAPEKFRVIPLGLDLAPFTGLDRESARTEARRKLGLGEADEVVAVVGRVVPIKNHRLLFRALALLSDAGRPVVALVVGDGEPRLVGELERLAAGIGLEGRVRWLGWRRDLPGLYAASDVLAVPSTDEGTPVAVIEALATGTPVVARAVGGIPEMLEGVPWASLVGSADPEDFANVLRSQLDAAPVPGVEREQVRAATARRYSTDRLVRDVVALYEEEIARSGSLEHGEP